MKNLLVSLSALTLTGPAMADESTEWGYGHGHMMGGYDGFGMFFGPVIMLILLAALVVGILALLRWVSPNSDFMNASPKSSNDALDTLNLRFAKGELDAKEYEDRKKLLLE